MSMQIGFAEQMQWGRHTKMSKIGILTFSNTQNYGAALQCFALFEYLKSLGNDVDVFDYRNRNIELTGKRRLRSVQSPKDFLLWILTHKEFTHF